MDYTAKLLSEFPGATEFKAEDLLFAFQDGQSRKLAGAVLQAFCRAAVDELVKRAETAAGDAEAAKNAIAALEVAANTLETGEPATADVELTEDKFLITFGLPKGDKGSPGVSIQSIERTEGNGASGTADTYTITLTDGSTTTFRVYNGKDGVVSFDSLTDEQKESLRGPKGNPFTYDDFTEEQLAALEGKPGHTPVRGEDFWTKEDKEEIVDDTIAALEESGFSGGGVQMELLWKNASPGTFVSQKIELDLTEYSEVGIIFSVENMYTLIPFYRIPIGCGGTCFYSGTYTHYRTFVVDETGVSFQNAFKRLSYGSSSAETANNLCFPYRIYGIKGVSA